MKKKSFLGKFFGVALSLALLASLLPNMEATAANEETSNYEYVNEGTILHAFCWNFNTIKENMADIAAAGYTAVQTSPINECESDYSDLTLMGSNGKWYYHYQPTDWKIGNYQLGTRDEFKEMCDVAESYGIKIIVDILPNHTAVDEDDVSEDLINAVGGADNLYHDTGHTAIGSYSDRLQCTRYSSGGLPDVDTENEGFQSYFYAYLEDCIACGADGFRIDTAKHIALPDDPAPEGVTNNFYTNMNEQVIDDNDLFVYGEVLQGGNERLAAYQEYIGGTTASDYGAEIRTALTTGDLSVSKISSYCIESEGDYTADADKLVTWVESHDNYLNDGTWSSLDSQDTVLGWAIIAARKDGTPLFFNRPAGSSTDNQYGDNVLGAAGDDTYKDDEVVAVNKFRSAMSGESENLRNPNNNSSVLMIERGDKGLVIVNASASSFNIDSETNLADGTYINKTDDDSVFTVTGGHINGTVPAKSVVVLYGPEETESTTVLIYNATNESNLTATNLSEAFSAQSEGDGWMHVTIPASLNEGFTLSISNGEEELGSYTFNAETGRYIVLGDENIYESKAAAEAAAGIERVSVYFFNTKCWDTVSVYSWLDDGTQLLGGWPGQAATYVGDYWWKAEIAVKEDTPFYVIFNNGGAGEQTANLYISDTEKVYFSPVSDTAYASEAEVEEATGISANETTVYFYNYKEWDQVSAYIYGGSSSFGSWPGKACEEVGDGWWKVTIDEGASMSLHIIFNDNGNGNQSSDFVISNIRDVYATGKNGTLYASMDAAIDGMGLGVERDPSWKTDVYYYNANGWDTVSAYIYGNQGEVFGGWPGKTAIDDGDGWWHIEVPYLVSEGWTIIFNNGGNGEQSPDTTLPDETHRFLLASGTTCYESKNEALGITEPEVTEPEVTEPEVTEPEVTEPEVTEPEVTEPEVTEPEVTEPEVTEPEVTEPEVTEPEVTEPEVTEPEVTEPEVVPVTPVKPAKTVNIVKVAVTVVKAVSKILSKLSRLFFR